MFGRKPCQGCAARDSEIQFLRSMLSSSRTIVRDPEPAIHVEQPIRERIREVPSDPMGPEVFNRNTVAFMDMVPVTADDGSPVGEDIRIDVQELNEQRRARIAARRGEN